MDEWTPFDSTPMLLGANAAMQPIDYQIDEVLDQCTDFILVNAPLRCVKSVEADPLPAVTITDRVATVIMPDDFLRLNRIKFADWINPLHVFTEYNTKTADLQRFRWTRGGARKPVAVLNEKEGAKNLECYTSDTELEYLYYVPSQHFDATDRDFMNDDALELLLSYVAATVYTRINETEFAQIATAEYNNILERIKTQG